MLYLAIPAHNEVATIGVLLWRLRTVLAEFPREYEVVVYDDASTDETALVAEQYVHAMPVTVLRGAKPIGYAGAVNALVRHIAAHTRYPRRDAMLLLQGDFTDPPGIVPEFARRFEGGADVVVGERTVVVDAPVPVRRLFSAAGWALRPFVRVEGVRDLTGSMRLMRISALRDLLRTVGDDAVCAGDSWTANADLLLRLVPHARRVETVPVEPTYGVRTRDTRRVTVRDALAALRWGWRARGRRAVPTSAPEPGSEVSGRTARPAGSSRRRDEPEVTADRLRERSRDRERLRGDAEVAPSRRDGRPERSRRDGARAELTDEQKVERLERKRHEKSGEQPNEKRNETKNGKRTEKRPQADDQQPKARADVASEPRSPRPPRPERQPRRGRNAPLDANAELILDDPFAAPRSASGQNLSAPRPSAADPAEADGERSPYAEMPTPTRGEAAGEVEDTRDSGGDQAANERAFDGAIDDGTNDGLDDGLDDASADSETGEANTDSSLDARERKRRRNRRSRRRKSKQRGDSVEAGADLAAPDDGAKDGKSPYRTDGAHSDDASGREDGDGDSDDAESDGDDRSASDGVEAEGGDGERAARARRRGRRGRRGGSRRSRGRGRESAESDGTASTGDGPAAPPATPPSSDTE